ncbi:MAG TPA: hypothetical protein VF053_08805 [Streptosporangiales bacterium]
MTTLAAVWMVVLGVGCMVIRLVGIMAVVLYARRSSGAATTHRRSPAFHDHEDSSVP